MTAESIQKSGVAPEEIAAVSFSVQRSSCLLVDENGEALNNIMVWLDTRADETMDDFAALISPEYTEEITGMPCNSIYANCKFFWMMKHTPEIWDKAAYISTIDSYIMKKFNNPDFKKFTGIMVSTTPNIGVFEVEGIQNSGATCYRWAKETFCSVDSQIAEELGMDAFDFMGQYVEQSRPGANGLIFSAALFGTGYPTWNLGASGAFIGIKETHKKGDFLRAVMEGVTLEARYMLESMKEVGVDVNPVITITGGATKSPVWRQIIADVMGVTCRTLDVSDAPLIGVAGLAAIGAGLFTSREEAVENMVHYKDTVEPIPENVKIYNKVFDVYKTIYHSLNDNGVYNALNNLYE